MATGIFTLRNQLQGLIQKAWTTPQPTYYGSFNGSTQYLSTPSIALGSGNWTIEFFLYLNTVSTAFYFDGRGGGSNGFQPTIYYNGSIYFYTNGGIVITGPSLNSGQWYHVAVSKVSGSTRLFLNGVQQGSTYSDSNTYVASSTNIQYIGGGLFFTNGLISNLRITNTGLYSANFAPPTLQLTAVSGTQLLTLQNSTIIDNSTNAYTITNNGSVATAQSNLVFPNAQKTPAVDYLVVAGGGGGDYAGGGGAGGLIQGISSITTGSSITVTVGSGGAGDVAANGAAAQGGVSVFNNISTTGGGAGINNGTALASKNSGGSGGGGGINASLNSAGQGTFGQGNIGGTSTSTNAGGGGGAGTVGLNATTYSGNGGAGIASAISGTVTTYAGGGGGGAASSYNSNVGSGGVGGGGSGSITNGTSGTANTGGGGGGSGYNGSSYGNGGSGGSGIVIIRYPNTFADASSVTNGTKTSITGFTVYTFLSSGSITF